MVVCKNISLFDLIQCGQIGSVRNFHDRLYRIGNPCQCPKQRKGILFCLIKNDMIVPCLGEMCLKPQEIQLRYPPLLQEEFKDPLFFFKRQYPSCGYLFQIPEIQRPGINGDDIVEKILPVLLVTFEGSGRYLLCRHFFSLKFSSRVNGDIKFDPKAGYMPVKGREDPFLPDGHHSIRIV